MSQLRYSYSVAAQRIIKLPSVKWITKGAISSDGRVIVSGVIMLFVRDAESDLRVAVSQRNTF